MTKPEYQTNEENHIKKRLIVIDYFINNPKLCPYCHCEMEFSYYNAGSKFENSFSWECEDCLYFKEAELDDIKVRIKGQLL